MEELAQWLSERTALVVLTGAGCSTPSGIGDYRDRHGEWKRAAPIQHADFVRAESVRKRYWARSFHGWPHFTLARPNPAHEALARLAPTGIITQNVDRLHQAAGSDAVIDLHGRLDEVICLSCGELSARDEMQERINELNPALGGHTYQAAPDGDADLQMSDAAIAQVRVPEFLHCCGVLKPNVVFYGDNVPKSRVEAAYAWVDACDGLLVVGSSLMVFSGLRFCRRAAARGVSMVLVNRGRTRGDDLFSHRVDADCAEVLPKLVS